MSIIPFPRVFRVRDPHWRSADGPAAPAHTAPRVGVSRIDIWGQPVGFAVPFRQGVRFIAGETGLASLDGAVFPTLGHARLAAVAQVRHSAIYSDGRDV